ncbi:phosphatase PAP2 family protein [Prevotella sp. PINT]|jgi:Membrane-associated phospholipid phosphatase|uniref:phosphatase PAP2 family protein n=1 Tax=Palleniella intestinalis TaxID=2736291 RepID=UPI0015554DE7|nr:phosphatase PAP2 family protein [Palleniella intestinalis]NPD81784.1 phosphatase PAP2 family protein [Palleniella intestinalis]
MLRTLAILLATACSFGVRSATSCTLYNNDAETYGDDLTVVYPTGKHEVENYLRFSPYAILAGLKLSGCEGRSDLPRFLTSAAVSNVIMAGAVTAAKHTFKAQRPDHSDNKSFPSGHAAVAFTAATILHKEYGATRSPWFSLGGYALAAGTSMLRVAHNRHRAGDVAAGAGIGILSVELGYLLADLIYGNRGLNDFEQEKFQKTANPSFLDVQMGVGVHKSTLRFLTPDGMEKTISLRASAVAGLEGAYFFNEYVGIGGMARVTTTPADIPSITEKYGEMAYFDDNIFTDMSFDAGVYGNIPVGNSVAFGAKALCGMRFSDGICVRNDDLPSQEMLKVKGGNAVNFVMGISASWRCRDNFAWKIFADMDTSKSTYTYQSLLQASAKDAPNQAVTAESKHWMTHFTIGGAFTVQF